MHLLRLLLGPPCTLNVRNLVWHGFPAPGQLPHGLLSLLLLLAAALGALLAGRRAVPARTQVTYSPVSPAAPLSSSPPRRRIGGAVLGTGLRA